MSLTISIIALVFSTLVLLYQIYSERKQRKERYRIKKHIAVLSKLMATKETIKPTAILTRKIPAKKATNKRREKKSV